MRFSFFDLNFQDQKLSNEDLTEIKSIIFVLSPAL